jgi:hypothetical protein
MSVSQASSLSKSVFVFFRVGRRLIRRIESQDRGGRGLKARDVTAWGEAPGQSPIISSAPCQAGTRVASDLARSRRSVPVPGRSNGRPPDGSELQEGRDAHGPAHRMVSPVHHVQSDTFSLSTLLRPGTAALPQLHRCGLTGLVLFSDSLARAFSLSFSNPKSANLRSWIQPNALEFPSTDIRRALPQRFDRGRGWNASLPHRCVVGTGSIPGPIISLGACVAQEPDLGGQMRLNFLRTVFQHTLPQGSIRDPPDQSGRSAAIKLTAPARPRRSGN